VKSLRLVQPEAPSRGGPAPARDAIRDLLVGLVREAMREEMAELEPQPERGPVLLDREGLAKALGVSVATIDRARAAGLPEIRVCDAPRFCVNEAISFFRQRSTK
jgi:hypothetical protein